MNAENTVTICHGTGCIQGADVSQEFVDALAKEAGGLQYLGIWEDEDTHIKRRCYQDHGVNLLVPVNEIQTFTIPRLDPVKFLDTNVGKDMLRAVNRLDSLMDQRGRKDDLSYEGQKIQGWINEEMAKFRAYADSISQFYGIHKLYFSRTAECYGACTLEQDFWLIKVERGTAEKEDKS
ncbi:MAG: hypothetical protein LUD50_02995 [Clostridia bacterium]|nr:hypothetical protein [Clostridia bacterium]